MSKPILVAGATGQQGGAVVKALLEKGLAVRAITRHPDGEKARALKAAGWKWWEWQAEKGPFGHVKRAPLV